ncbi:MAG: hypothetical protein HZB29_05010 [Nitrospinae bacterium]|nr:hypothetical protein [Nitrospinota bacterium]
MPWYKKTRTSPPQPDVPIPPSQPMPPTAKSGATQPEVEDAKFRMASKMDKGGSPYDFGGENEGGGGGFAVKITAAAAVAALLLVLFFGWKFLSDVSGKLDGVNKNVTDLSANLKAQHDAFATAGRAVVRSELRKTLTALDNAIALGDPAVTDKALKLRDDVKALLGEPINIKDSAAPIPSSAVPAQSVPAPAPAPAKPAAQAAPQAALPAPTQAPVKMEGVAVSPYGPAPTAGAAPAQTPVKPAVRPAQQVKAPQAPKEGDQATPAAQTAAETPAAEASPKPAAVQ